MNIGALREVASILNRVKVPYAVTGGVAAVYYDVPRMTFDVDILISSLETSQTEKLAKLLVEKDPSLKAGSVRRTLKEGGIIRVNWGDVTVVDFVIKKEVGLILERAIEAEGIKIVSLEDLVLQKLSVICAAPRGTIRFQDREDVEVLLAIHRGDLDIDYLKEEAKKAGTASLLSRFLGKAFRRKKL